MKKMFTAINCLAASVITTLLILTSSFIIMLFSSAKEGYRTSYFGSLFFSSTPTMGGALDLKFGVASATPIVVTIILLFVIYLFLFQFFKKLRHRQQ